MRGVDDYPFMGQFMSMTLDTFIAAQRISRKEFAEKIGAPERSVGKWCRGEVVPRRGALKKISAATGGLVTANDFLFHAESRTSTGRREGQDFTAHR